MDGTCSGQHCNTFPHGACRYILQSDTTLPEVATHTHTMDFRWSNRLVANIYSNTSLAYCIPALAPVQLFSNLG